MVTATVDKLVETELKGYLVEMRPTKGGIVEEAEKRQIVTKSCFELVDKNRVKAFIDNSYPYRKELELNVDKYEENVKAIDDVYKNHGFNNVTVYKEFRAKVRKSIRNRTLMKDFGVDDNSVKGKDFKLIIEEIFKQNNGKLELELDGKYKVKTVVTHQGLVEYLDAKNKLKEIYAFDNVLKRTDSDYENLTGKKEVPIYFETSKFLKFDRGQALISFRLDISTIQKENFTNALVNFYTDKLKQEGVEIVNLSHAKNFALLNILCPNEKVNEVLQMFAPFYKRLDKKLYDLNYNLDIEIEFNIGQENYKSEWYYLLTGKHFESIKDSFTLQKGKYLGLDLYR
ncbi:hypothetical protein COF68_04465 [Bacillus toyonensis]|uniref:hypothetical protein n=1 Tax=Bacillus toyonensis TaxID=155322 RepID=UPI000BFC77CB|nr:hypothetical protein [Bacillus toyonensis]PHE64109.1 hypothetical protein COF68_04465 [Bacillus toyonensis]